MTPRTIAAVGLLLAAAGIPACGPADRTGDRPASDPTIYELQREAQGLGSSPRRQTIAQAMLGYKYLNGDGVPQNNRAAVHWFRKAARNGHPEAQAALAVLYTRGKGVHPDFKLALLWATRAAAQGHKTAATLRDELQRMTPEQRQALNTNAGAFRMAEELDKLPDDIGERIQEGAEEIRNTPPLDKILEAEARQRAQTPGQDKPDPETMRQAAEAGHPRAQADLGQMYYFGYDLPQSYEDAATWLQPAAEAGIPRAQSLLGCMYAAGTGVPRNISQAVTWLKKAAMQGYAPAQFHLDPSSPASANHQPESKPTPG